MADKAKPTAFKLRGFEATIRHLVREVQEIYRADAIPWVVGYSGGKDSTATLQIVWHALEELEPEERTKPVHVISTDTLVENPVVAAWVTKSLETMEAAAQKSGLPIHPHRLTPEVKDTFWVNLIGKGYPAPRPKFRWCTERLKIRPSNNFISNVVRENGEAILVLGTRRAESSSRSANMAKHAENQTRHRLSPNASLPNSLVFSPIEDWSNDDVWLYLMQKPNPWGYRNKDLLTMYQGASEDGECPLVVDTSTPSCGDSRFGCWVCTLVDKDRSMHAMIQNDDEKEWMLPLLELRNELDAPDREIRDFRRMTGRVQLFHDAPIPGPYIQSARENWLRKVLEVQRWIRDNGPEYVREIELISQAELEEIRRIWLLEKHEIEDNLPQIFETAMGTPFPRSHFSDNPVLGAAEMDLLREACKGDDLHFQLVRDLIAIEGAFSNKSKRIGLFDALEKAFRKGFFEDEADATDFARRRKIVKDSAEAGQYEELSRAAAATATPGEVES